MYGWLDECTIIYTQWIKSKVFEKNFFTPQSVSFKVDPFKNFFLKCWFQPLRKILQLHLKFHFLRLFRPLCPINRFVKPILSGSFVSRHQVCVQLHEFNQFEKKITFNIYAHISSQLLYLSVNFRIKDIVSWVGAPRDLNSPGLKTGLQDDQILYGTKIWSQN